MTLGDDELMTYLAGGELGLSLKPPKWLRNAVGSVVKVVAPVAAAVVPGGDMVMQLLGGGGGGGAVPTVAAGGLPVATGGTPSIAQLASINPGLNAALTAFQAAGTIAAEAEMRAAQNAGNTQLRADAAEKRSLADRLKKFAEDLYREVATRSVQLGRAAQEASQAIEHAGAAMEHGRQVVTPQPAPGIAGIVNWPAWGIGAAAGLAGVLVLKAISGGGKD